MTFELNKCCFCIDLRTGCLVIGYLNLIVDIVLIIFGILVLIWGIVAVSVSDQDFALVETVAHAFGGAAIVMAAIALVFFFLFLAFTIVLLVGLHQHKRGHIMAYMIYSLIFIVLFIIIFFASFTRPVEAADIIFDLLVILLNIYFLVVIRSYYLKMDSPAYKPAIYNTA